MVEEAYAKAVLRFNTAEIANENVVAQLNTTQNELAQAQTKLLSLQTAIAAAEAAALAS